MLLLALAVAASAEFITPAPTPIPTGAFQGFSEYENYTTGCSHVMCLRERGGYIKVFHSKFEEYGTKHVCAHELHAKWKCGCECYNEGEGEEKNWEHYLSDDALKIIEKSSASVCKVQKYGACWFMGGQGQSCRTVCDWRGRDFVAGVYAPTIDPITKYLLGREPAKKRMPKYVQECFIKGSDLYFPALEGGYGSHIPAEGWNTGTGYNDPRNEEQDFAAAQCSLACPCSLRDHEKDSQFRGGKKSCTEWFDDGYTNDGEYMICPAVGTCFHVYCDMTHEGGGWTLVMSRGDVGQGYASPSTVDGIPDENDVADIVTPMSASGKALAPKQWAALKQISVEFAFHIEDSGTCGANRTTYRRIHRGCVHGHDYAVIPSQTIKQCEAHCNADPKCRAFEFGLHRNTLHPTATPTKIPTTASPTPQPTQGVPCDPIDVKFANASHPDDVTAAELILKAKVEGILGTYTKTEHTANSGRPVYEFNSPHHGIVYLYSFFRVVQNANVWLISSDYTVDAFAFEEPANGYAQALDDAFAPSHITSLWDYYDPDTATLVVDPGHELFLEVECTIPPTPAPTYVVKTKNPTATPTISPTWSKPSDCRLQDSTNSDGCYGDRPVSLDLFIKEKGFTFGEMEANQHCLYSDQKIETVASKDECRDVALASQQDGENWNATSYDPFMDCSATQTMTCQYGTFGTNTTATGACTAAEVEVGISNAEVTFTYSKEVLVDTFSTVIRPSLVNGEGVRKVMISCKVNGVFELRGSYEVNPSVYGNIAHMPVWTKSFPQCKTDEVKIHGITPQNSAVGFTTMYDFQMKYGTLECADPGGTCTVYRDCNPIDYSTIHGYARTQTGISCGTTQFTEAEILENHMDGPTYLSATPIGRDDPSLMDAWMAVGCTDPNAGLLDVNFQADARVVVDSWKTMSDAMILENMFHICVANRDGTATAAQAGMCCGGEGCSVATCTHPATFPVTDYVGMNSVFQCSSLCDELLDCAHFAFGSNKCFLYKQCDVADHITDPDTSVELFERSCQWSQPIPNAVLNCPANPISTSCEEQFWTVTHGSRTLAECQQWCASTPNCTGISYGAFKHHCRLGVRGPDADDTGAAFWKLWGHEGSVDCSVTSICSASYYNSYSYDSTSPFCNAPVRPEFETVTKLGKGAWAMGEMKTLLKDRVGGCAQIGDDLSRCNLVQTEGNGGTAQCGSGGTDFNAVFGVASDVAPGMVEKTERCTFFSNALGSDPLWETGAECAKAGVYAEKADLYVRSRIPHSCKEYLEFGRTQSGQYLICPRSWNACFDVYCDMDNEGGGWTLVMSRSDLKVQPDAIPHPTKFYIPPGIGDGSALTAERWAAVQSISTEFAFVVDGNDIDTGSSCTNAWGRGFLAGLNTTSACNRGLGNLTRCDLIHSEVGGCNYIGGDYSSIFGKAADPLLETQDRCTYFSQRSVSFWTGADCIAGNLGMFAPQADMYVR